VLAASVLVMVEAACAMVEVTTCVDAGKVEVTIRVEAGIVAVTTCVDAARVEVTICVEAGKVVVRVEGANVEVTSWRAELARIPANLGSTATHL